MALVDDLRPLFDLEGTLSAEFGLRPYTVTIRTETWSGARVGAGTLSTSDVVLSPVPLVQQNSGANSRSWYGGGFIQGANGELILAEYRVGPITKPYTGGGYTISQLAPPVTGAKVRTLVMLSGDGFLSAGEPFEILHVDAQDPFAWMLYLRRRPVSGAL